MNRKGMEAATEKVVAVLVEDIVSNKVKPSKAQERWYQITIRNGDKTSKKVLRSILLRRSQRDLRKVKDVLNILYL